MGSGLAGEPVDEVATAFLPRHMAVLLPAAAASAVAFVAGYCAEGWPSLALYRVVVDAAAGVGGGGPQAAARGGGRVLFGDGGRDDFMFYRKPLGGVLVARGWGAVGIGGSDREFPRTVALLSSARGGEVYADTAMRVVCN